VPAGGAVWFLIALFVVAAVSGATATIAGFGIGSLLTPLIAFRYGMSVAIAAVAIPHAMATAFRFWRLRPHVNWAIVRSFGAFSAVGGLIGALLYTRLGTRELTIALGVLLLLTSIAGLTRWSQRWHPRGSLRWLLGGLSGLFGGLAGNQGGVRSAALLAFDLPPRAFVATATATALAVDAVRTPVYLWRAGASLLALLLPISVATIGVLVGTLAGERLLFRLSPQRFQLAVSMLIGVLALWLLWSAMS
jgi:uncharacterized membrane protein YfcA